MSTNTIVLASRDACIGCGACTCVCPQGCITMAEDSEGFLQPKIEKKSCVACHKCEKTCPILNKENISDDFETKAYAAINRDEEVRMHSSSGGIFYALAKWVIEHGGVVFGAKWDENWMVMHDYAENMEAVKAFMRSKYVESRVGDTYKQAKEFLQQDRWVLYSGTPCQLGGLRAYLRKEYEKLLQVDLLCHGAPSPKVWRKYLHDVHGHDEIVDINMRDKGNGWHTNYLMTTTTNTTTIHEKNVDNIYFKGFVKNVYLRKSCYDCKFKHVHRLSDITLGDFWAVDAVYPELYDPSGVSAVFVHSSKGDEILKQLRGIALTNKPLEPMVEANGRLLMSSKLTHRRKRFFVAMRVLPFQRLNYFIERDFFLIRVWRLMRKIIKRIVKPVK